MNWDEVDFGAIAAVLGGLALGWILVLIVRRFLDRDGRSAELRALAKPIARLLFWVAVAAGAVLGIGALSPGALEPVPGQVLVFLPRLLAAGLIAVIGWTLVGIASELLARTVRATGHGERVRTISKWVLGLCVGLLALGQLGIDVTILLVLITVTTASLGLTFALFTGLGSIDLAKDVAAGRASRAIKVGDQVSLGDIHGVVAQTTSTSLVLTDDRDGLIYVPWRAVRAERAIRVLPAAPADAASDS